MLSVTHPELAEAWEQSKNGTLLPSQVTRGSHKKVWWLFKECGHSYERQVKHQVNGHGCKICYRKVIAHKTVVKKAESKGSLSSEVPELLAEIVDSQGWDLTHLNIRSYVWVTWRCSTCSEEWSACIRERVQGRGKCPVCSNRKLRVGLNDLATLAPELAGELVNKLAPVLANSGEKVSWLCKRGHEWGASPKERIAGLKPCPRCRRGKKTSTGQAELRDVIESKGFKLEENVRIPNAGRLEMDIFIRDLSIGFEFNGAYWHSDKVTLQSKGMLSADAERKKLKAAADAGIKLFLVWEQEWTDSTKRAELVTYVHRALNGESPDELLKVSAGGGEAVKLDLKDLKPVKPPKFKRELTDELKEEFRQLYFSGREPRGISEELRVPMDKLYQLVKDEDLAEKRADIFGFAKNGSKCLKRHETIEARKLYAQGEDFNSLSIKYGVGYKALTRDLNPARRVVHGEV